MLLSLSHHNCCRFWVHHQQRATKRISVRAPFLLTLNQRLAERLDPSACPFRWAYTRWHTENIMWILFLCSIFSVFLCSNENWIDWRAKENIPECAERMVVHFDFCSAPNRFHTVWIHSFGWVWNRVVRAFYSIPSDRHRWAVDLSTFYRHYYSLAVPLLAYHPAIWIAVTMQLPPL